MIACFITGRISGEFCGLVELKVFVMAIPGILSVEQFINKENSMNFIYAYIAICISVGVSFILTLIIGFEDPVEENINDLPLMETNSLHEEAE